MKALIVYGSRSGATREIAGEIGRVLSEQGYAVTVEDARRSKGLDVNRFDLVVVGSSVFMTMWKRHATAFLKRNAKALAVKNVALFSSGTAGGDPALADYARESIAKVARKFPEIRPVALAYFGGYLDFNDRGRIDRFFGAVRQDFEKKGIDTGRPIDQRDWAAIRVWAIGLATKVRSTVQEMAQA
ncbi:MAG: protoporphyrinogen oxidase [Methanocella sp. PtaU1.Bin125]|nr:MAG: protoporphyrinogen oxidase [Methanocella sp. PtaU1.Bin125]